MMNEEPFTREEVVAGLPARRASTLLFLIESRTAHLVAQSRQGMKRFLTEEAAEERDLAFLEAFALDRDPPISPTIQHLGRYAPQRASLVPDNPECVPPSPTFWAKNTASPIILLPLIYWCIDAAFGRRLGVP